jgi:transposase
MITYVGLDVHKRIVEACVLDAAGQVVHRERFELTRKRLLQFCGAHLTKESHVALEATTNTWTVVEMLRPLVAEVVVSNPLQTKYIALAKVKTDKVDALVLAQLLRCDFLPRIWQPDAATLELRRLTHRRASLVGQQTAVKNRLHSVLHQRMLGVPCDKLFSAQGLTWLRHLELDEEGRLLLDSDLRLLEAIAAELAVLDSLLAKKAHAQPRVKLLMTLPGVDVTVALGVLAALGDIGRFRDGAHAAAYLGLVPRTKQSAAHCYHGPITKAGNRQARWLLVQAAQNLGRHPGPLGHFFRRLAHKKNRNVAVVATARKLAVIAWHLLTKNEPYRYAQPAATQTKLARLRVRATGHKRKSGPKAGFAGPKLAPGVKTRTIAPLASVLEGEGLPGPGPLPAGESRTVTQSACSDYVLSLSQTQVQARGTKKRAAAVTAAAPPLGASEG